MHHLITYRYLIYHLRSSKPHFLWSKRDIAKCENNALSWNVSRAAAGAKIVYEHVAQKGDIAGGNFDRSTTGRVLLQKEALFIAGTELRIYERARNERLSICGQLRQYWNSYRARSLRLRKSSGQTQKLYHSGFVCI